MFCRPIVSAYFSARITCKEFYFRHVTKVSANDFVGCFVRVGTLDIFLCVLAESKLDHLFEEEMDNVRREVISYRYV